MSPSSVPTWDEFNALQARVTALENAATPVPPEPIPPEPTPPTEGIQAKRVADLIGSFGVNTFSSMDDGNVWGSWPSDYQPDSVIAGLKFILADSGHAFRLREYHYRGRESFQQPWLRQVTQAIPGTRASLCVAANGTPDDVPTMLGMAEDPTCNVAWVEGLNEPNTDFGWGMVPVETTLAIQQATAPAACRVMGPSIVAGMPHPEGWVTGYMLDKMPELLACMDWGNGHYYPPHAPDIPNTGWSVNEYIGGLWQAYEQHPIALTEFHPTLYAASREAVQANIMRLANRWRRGDAPQLRPFAASPARDAFYTLQTLLRCAKNGTLGLWWYALYDYGSTYQCGLFPTHGADNPRPAAIALQTLCVLCADTGDKHGFIPDVLDVAVSSLTGVLDLDVYQASDGRFLLPIWYPADDAGQGSPESVVLNFGSRKNATLFDVLQGGTDTTQFNGVDVIALDLLPGVYLLEIEP